MCETAPATPGLFIINIFRRSHHEHKEDPSEAGDEEEESLHEKKIRSEDRQSDTCMLNPQKKTPHQRAACRRLKGPDRIRRTTLRHYRRRR